MRQLYTIGYSKYEMFSFIRTLKSHGIEVVADVRSSPSSKYKSEFNMDVLKKTLIKTGIGYVFLGKELGARRTENECYVGDVASYGLIRKEALFIEGLNRINKGLEKYKIALMCAEADPLRCHRDILVCKSLKRDDVQICHILPNDKVEDNDSAEKRLMRECSSDEADLFYSYAEMLDAAYIIRGNEIAYRRGAQHGTED